MEKSQLILWLKTQKIYVRTLPPHQVQSGAMGVMDLDVVRCYMNLLVKLRVSLQVLQLEVAYICFIPIS